MGTGNVTRFLPLHINPDWWEVQGAVQKRFCFFMWEEFKERFLVPKLLFNLRLFNFVCLSLHSYFQCFIFVLEKTELWYTFLTKITNRKLTINICLPKLLYRSLFAIQKSLIFRGHNQIWMYDLTCWTHIPAVLTDWHLISVFWDETGSQHPTGRVCHLEGKYV